MLDKTKEVIGVSSAPSGVKAVRSIFPARDAELIDWLSAVGGRDLEIEWTAEQLVIYGYDSIIDRQKGYATKASGAKGDWLSSWLVIGDVLANPIILDSSTIPCPVLFARYGQGSWAPRQLAKSVYDLAKAVDIWTEFYYIRFNKEILNSDFENLSSFQKEISAALRAVLSEDEVRTFLFAMT